MQRNMKYQLIFVRMAIIKTKDKCWINCGETETLAFCWWKAKWCSFYEKHDGSSKKKKKEYNFIWSNNCVSEYLPKRTESRILKICQQSHISCSIIYNNQDVGITKMPINGWMAKEDVRINILQYVIARMNLEDIMRSYISQSQKDKSRMILLTWCYD